MRKPEYRWRVYRATFDTNVFLRSLLRGQNRANHLLALLDDDRFVLVLSQPIVDEIKKVASRPNLMRKYQYAPRAVTALVELLTNRAVFVEVPFSYQLCRDVGDDRVVDCAIWGRVQFLISYDNDIVDDPELSRALFEYGIAVATPEKFAQRLEEALIG